MNHCGVSRLAFENCGRCLLLKKSKVFRQAIRRVRAFPFSVSSLPVLLSCCAAGPSSTLYLSKKQGGLELEVPSLDPAEQRDQDLRPSSTHLSTSLPMADARTKASTLRPELDKFLSFTTSSRKTQSRRPTNRLRPYPPPSLHAACPGACGTPEVFSPGVIKKLLSSIARRPSTSPLVFFFASPCFPVLSSQSLHRWEPTTFDKRLGRLENTTLTSSQSQKNVEKKE